MDPFSLTLEGLQRCIEIRTDEQIRNVFTEAFLSQLPVSQLRELLAQMHKDYGSCIGYTILERQSENSARIRLVFENGCRMDGRVAINSQNPPKITLLLFGFPSLASDSWNEIEKDIGLLPGQSSFEIQDLSAGKPLARLHSDRALGIGSLSKLLILGLLLSEVSSRHRRWEDVLVLEERDLSLPTGILQDWPVGSLLTLDSLVVLLLSVSDNTAADLLLRVLGRERVEEYAHTHGIGDPDRTKPFFSTRGLFNLLDGPESVKRQYLAAGESERRDLLKAAEARAPNRWAGDSCVWPDGFDWYLSASDIIALLDQIRLELDASGTAKCIFGMNDGGLSSSRWSFAGFKGGSSPGRLALATLLQDVQNRWVAACLIVNATPETLNVENCAKLVKRATDLALSSS
jgi:hypothetical protein